MPAFLCNEEKCERGRGLERGGEERNGRAITLFVLSIVILSHDLEAQAVELRSSRNSENLYRSVSQD